jgi:hypothetical protein
METLPIQEFNLNEMCTSPSICIIGRMSGGRTWLVGDILEHYENDNVTAITPIKHNDSHYHQFNNIKEIHSEYDSLIINKLLNDQSAAIEESKDNTIYAHENSDNNDTINDRIRDLLNKIQNITQSSLNTQNLINQDIDRMKDLVCKLAEEKQKMVIKNQLKITYETIGAVLKQEDVEISELLGLNESIDQKLRCLSPCNSVPKSTTNHILLLDDCLQSHSSWSKDDNFMQLMLNNKYYHITNILSMSHSLGISPILRSNFDYIFLFAEDRVSELKRIYEHYAGFFSDFTSFRQVFEQLTADHGCMVIRNKNIIGYDGSLLNKIAFYRTRAE